MAWPGVRWAHPRACGENSSAALYPAIRVGSSPRVRGKQGSLDAGGRARGLIPARAGKTSRRGGVWWRSWAHPRACGENSAAHLTDEEREGSSPRVRGKRARGGPRRPTGLSHPRACGENGPYRDSLYAEYGSSPRVRGKPEPHPNNNAISGLIPARAGKTIQTVVKGATVAAHPRACGEN